MAVMALKSFDSLYLSVDIYEVNNPRAVVHIIHGLRDHKLRYQELISWLNANNFNVVIADLRGHGKSISDKYPIGYIASMDELLNDEEYLLNLIKTRFPNLDLYLYAHSFGTIIAQLFLSKNSNQYKKVIFSSLNYINIGEINAGLKMAKVFNKNKYSDTLDSYVSLDKDDYLCTKKEEIENFRNDSLANIKYRNISISTILSCYKEVTNLKRYQNISPNIKILVLMGEKDSLTKGYYGLNESINFLYKVGYKEIYSIVYKDMATEIFKEYNKEQVFVDINYFFLNK